MYSAFRYLLLGSAGLLASAAIASTARADITHFQDFRLCDRLAKGCEGKGPALIRQGETRRIAIKGQEVNTCKAVAINGTSVTVRKLSDKLVADGFSVGTGQIDISIAVGGTATPGARTVTLSRCGVFADLSFRLTAEILRNGTATGVNAVPRQSNFFTQIDLTITGTNMAGAAMRAHFTTAPSANAQATLLSSNATSAVVRVTFSAGQSKSVGTIQLFAAGAPSGCLNNVTFSCYGTPVEITILGPNAIQSITFPTGSNILVGSILTIRVRLTQPAPSSGGRLTLPGQISGGELIKWDVHPEASFGAETGTSFSPTVELNNFTIPAGSQQADLVVRLERLPAGCSSNCTGTVEVRTNDFRDAAPYKKTATFTMRAF